MNLRVLTAFLLIILPFFALGGNYTGYVGNSITRSVTIGSGSTATAGIDLKGFNLVAIVTPATLSTSTFTYSSAESLVGTYVQVLNSSGTVSTTVSTSRYYAVDPNNFLGVQFLKLTGGTTEAAARTIILHLKGQ